MKVLHIASQGRHCGISTYTQNLINHFPKDDVSHEFLGIPSKQDLYYYSEARMFSWARQLVKSCDGYDVIHIQNEFGLFAGPSNMAFALKVFYEILKGLKKNNKKVLVTFHSEPIFMKALGWLNFEERACARFWKKISKLFSYKNGFVAIVHNRTSAGTFLSSGFQNVEIVVHGVVERHVPNFTDLENSNTINISLFGFLSDYKGHEFALSILDLLPENFFMTFIGGRHPESDGEEIGRLLKIATELNVLKRLLITGWVSPEEATIHQSRSDISIAPYQTRELSASGAITWSLTSNNPVIASNIRSFRSINKEIECMLLCHPNDRLEWVWAIKRLATDSNLYKKMQTNAQEYCSKFSWSNTCLHHLELYKQTLS